MSLSLLAISLPSWMAMPLSLPALAIWLPALLGGVAIYLLLPRPRSFPVSWGLATGVAALVLTALLVVPSSAPWPETVLFYAFSALAILAGVLLITQHNPARAALSFNLVVLSTCGLFLLLAAPFLMAATVIIYAGAIVVTFLFVIMLAQQEGFSSADDRSREPLLSALTGFLLLGTILYLLARGNPTDLDELLARTREAVQAAERGDMARVKELVVPVDRFSVAIADLGATGGQHQAATPWMLALHSARVAGEPRHRNGDSLMDRYMELALLHGQDNLRKDGAFWVRVAQQVRTETDNLSFNINSADNEEEVAKLCLENLLALENLGKQLRGRVGTVPLSGDASLSAMSGPAANTPLSEVRHDKDTGLPALPAENSAYLGRSLFTDYLLPVELGGLLLLVATIGSIAIAQRQPPSPPSSIPGPEIRA